MFFNLKRFYYGIVKRQKLLFLLLIIPCVYLIGAALISDRFVISQNIFIADNTPVASAVNPVAFKPFRDIKNDSSEFFSNQYDIKNSVRIVAASWEGKYSSKVIREAVENCKFTLAETKQMQITYSGKHLELGRVLVAYYSGRLDKKTQEGIVRSGNFQVNSFQPIIQGDLKTIKLRSVWRSDRLVPFCMSILLSFGIVFTMLGLMEWSDSSFKSERQIAMYTELPIIGSVPNLNIVSEKLRYDAEIT